MLGYGVEESNNIDVNDIATKGGILVPINDAFGEIWH